MPTKPMTFRLPAELVEFVNERATELHEDKTAVVVGALRAEMRRRAVERERAVLGQHGGNPYPDLPPATTDALAETWKDMDW